MWWLDSVSKWVGYCKITNISGNAIVDMFAIRRNRVTKPVLSECTSATSKQDVRTQIPLICCLDSKRSFVSIFPRCSSVDWNSQPKAWKSNQKKTPPMEYIIGIQLQNHAMLLLSSKWLNSANDVRSQLLTLTGLMSIFNKLNKL